MSTALHLDSLISNFDKLLTVSGGTTLASYIHKVQIANYDSFSQGLLDIIEAVTLGRAKGRYGQLEECTTDIIASLYEQPYISDIKLPELPDIGHDDLSNLKQLVIYVAQVKVAIQPYVDNESALKKKHLFLSSIDQKKLTLNKGFFYEFSDDELERIQLLINELRKEIAGSVFFEESHKARLLRRLEAMQSELHKKMSDIDKIWGLVGDAGVVMKKLGQDAKPIVDRIKELSQIAWKTQARAEELPSNSQHPLLDDDSII